MSKLGKIERKIINILNMEGINREWLKFDAIVDYAFGQQHTRSQYISMLRAAKLLEGKGAIYIKKSDGLLIKKNTHWEDLQREQEKLKQEQEKLSTIRFGREYLKETKISNYAKDVLTEQAVIYYNRLKAIIPGRDQRIKSAFFLSCDKYMCSIPRILPHPKVKYLKEARKELGIPPVLSALDRVDSVANLLGITDSDIRQRAVTFLKEYYTALERGHKEFFLLSPTILACAALIFGSGNIKPNYQISISDAAREIGTTTTTLATYLDTISAFMEILRDPDSIRATPWIQKKSYREMIKDLIYPVLKEAERPLQLSEIKERANINVRLIPRSIKQELNIVQIYGNTTIRGELKLPPKSYSSLWWLKEKEEEFRKKFTSIDELWSHNISI